MKNVHWGADRPQAREGLDEVLGNEEFLLLPDEVPKLKVVHEGIGLRVVVEHDIR